MQVLEKCSAALAGVKEEIYVDLANIASKPLDRYQTNFKSEQQAKMNAFSILRSSGKHAQSVLRRTAGFGMCGPHSAPSPLPSAVTHPSAPL